MAARNHRPRGAVVSHDNTDELNLWNTVLDRMKTCQDINERYREAAAKIVEAEQNVSDDDPTSALAALEVISTNHRECLKLSEAELNIMNEEPDDLIKNLETLISVTTALESETPAPRERHHIPQSIASAANGVNGKPSRNGKRKLEATVPEPRAESPVPTATATQLTPVVAVPAASATSTAAQPPLSKKASRSGSVSATAASKVESTSDTETVRATSTAAASPTSTTGATQPPMTQSGIKFAIGNEVFYRSRSKDKTDEGEGIICIIKNILGEGKQRRYEVQDIEPDDNDHMPTFKAALGSLVAIPTSNLGLPPLPKGRSVFARYPQTNTFYKAEVVGKAAKKDTFRLKFDGEEDAGTEKDVERRYVLEIK